MKNEKNRIQSPEGVARLMENLWLRHKAGLKQPGNNVFYGGSSSFD